jgi:hypothetical protein
MSASALAPDLVRVPLETSPFRSAAFSEDETRKRGDQSRAKQIKRLLKRVGLTMGQVSALTSMQYGSKTPYFIPRSFLYKQKKGTTPHVCQMAALSQVTGYRFDDWMSLCGFDLKLILALQLKIHVERTAIVTPDRNFPACGRNSESSGQHNSNGRYLFAKIGRRDAVLYPKLVPGSIVRADRWFSPDTLDEALARDRIWLVQHPDGMTCCVVKRVDREHVYLLPNRPPLSPWPLRISKEARVLGLIDLEFRPREPVQFEPMSSPKESGFLPLASHSDMNREFSMLLRASRLRAGLTFRAAHKMTLRIAGLLQNAEYSISVGLLSDYEAMNKLPRHIAKIVSLCVIYGLDPFVMMEAGGIYIDDSDKVSLFSDHERAVLRESA